MSVCCSVSLSTQQHHLDIVMKGLMALKEIKPKAKMLRKYLNENKGKEVLQAFFLSTVQTTVRISTKALSGCSVCMWWQTGFEEYSSMSMCKGRILFFFFWDSPFLNGAIYCLLKDYVTFILTPCRWKVTNASSSHSVGRCVYIADEISFNQLQLEIHLQNT